MATIGTASDQVLADLRRLAGGSPEEITLFVGVLAAPMVAAILVFQRHRLAWFGALGWLATIVAWFGVYASGRLAGGADTTFTVVGIGIAATWIALLVAAMASATKP